MLCVTIEPDHPELHEGVEDGHLVLAADEGQGVVKAGGAEAFVGDAALGHRLTFLSVSIAPCCAYLRFFKFLL